MKVRTVKQLVVLALILAPLGLGAQEFSSPVLAAGQFRVELSALFYLADERFGRRVEDGSVIKEVEPLEFDFVDTAVGSRLFPAFEDLESDLTTVAGTAITPVVLGGTRAILTRDVVWLPLRLDLGLRDWLTVGTTVPFSRRRAEFATSIQADGADVGLPPGGAGTFLGEVFTANEALGGVVTTLCTADPSSPACSQATSLLAAGVGYHESLTRAYGDYGVFPLEGSGTGDALQSNTTSLVNAYQAAGVSFPATIPLATEVLTEATYLDLVSNPVYRVKGDSLQTWRSPWELGDVEIHANARLWSIGLDTAPDEPQPNLRLELGAGALYRLGSGRIDSPRNFLDTGSGDGQNDFELSGFGTLGVGRRLSMVGEFRYGIQQSVLVLKRVTAPDRIFAPASAEQVVRWNPGDYMQVRVSPRFSLTKEIGLVLDLRYFTKKRDQYTSVEAGVGLDPGVLNLETAQESFGIGGGVVYSTIPSGRGWPIEARFLFQEAVSGNGGATPKTWRAEVGVRFLWGLWE
ncbi:MAG TPA: hypothetical protein DCG16_06680 [Gemmatimonadetes bacterium]|nr:hypothetical protein [Gemmatimonadota bacterium]